MNAVQHTGSKYRRLIYPAHPLTAVPIEVDVYAVIHAWKVTEPGRQQALKKILQTGERDKADKRQDLVEAIDAIRREIEIIDQQTGPVSVPLPMPAPIQTIKPCKHTSPLAPDSRIPWPPSGAVVYLRATVDDVTWEERDKRFLYSLKVEDLRAHPSKEVLVVVTPPVVFYDENTTQPPASHVGRPR